MISLFFCKFFVEIADTGNISSAAEKMVYSQSALSHAINRAEQELGFKLFKRTKHGVALTEESKALLPLARQIVLNIDKMNEEISSIQRLKTGHIKIGTFVSVSMHFLPKLLKSFAMNYPGITIEIIEGSKKDMQRLLADNSIDIAFTSLAPNDPVDQIALFDDPIVAVFPKNTDIQIDENNRFIMQNLNQYNFIAPIMDNSIDLDIECAINQSNLHLISAHVSSLDYISIMSMIRSGLGVSLLPKLITFDFMDSLTIMHTAPQFYRTIGMEINSTKDVSFTILEFIQYVKSYTINFFMSDYEQYGFILRCDPDNEKREKDQKRK